jgi:hypothetical protein
LSQAVAHLIDLADLQVFRIAARVEREGSLPEVRTDRGGLDTNTTGHRRQIHAGCRRDVPLMRRTHDPKEGGAPS